MNDQSKFHEKPSKQDPGSLFLRALFLSTLVLVLLCIVGFLIVNGVLLITGYKVEYEEILPILEKAAGWVLLAASIPFLAVTAALALDLLKTAFTAIKNASPTSNSDGDS